LHFQHFEYGYSKGSLNFPFLMGQEFTDLITGNLSDAFQISAKSHPVHLQCLIPYLSDPIAEN
jgi:hypothetical protein